KRSLKKRKLTRRLPNGPSTCPACQAAPRKDLPPENRRPPRPQNPPLRLRNPTPRLPNRLVPHLRQRQISCAGLPDLSQSPVSSKASTTTTSGHTAKPAGKIHRTSSTTSIATAPSTNTGSA